jgi:hypothetical protein
MMNLKIFHAATMLTTPAIADRNPNALAGGIALVTNNARIRACRQIKTIWQSPDEYRLWGPSKKVTVI